MSKYIIQKSIEAVNMTEALKNETRARIVECWKDKEAEKSQLTSAIGFQSYESDEE